MRNSYCDSNFTIGIAFPLSELNRSVNNRSITDENNCMYELCQTVSADNPLVKENPDILTHSVDGGKYAVYHFKGFPKFLYMVYQEIFCRWLSRTGNELDERPIFDVYRDMREDGYMEIDICFPLKSGTWHTVVLLGLLRYAKRVIKWSSLSEDDKVLYWTIAKDEVKKQLKSPSTAKFPFAANSEGVSITKTGDIVTVSAHVDAQNSFGAMLRNNFSVKIKLNGTKYSISLTA